MSFKSSPLVSVIIATKNEEKNIDNCLRSIKLQTYPQEKIEIIVVDNNSIDKTKQTARKYTPKVFNCGPERSAQRNFGIKKARGKYVLHLDADMSLSPQLIEECAKKLEGNESFIALYIPEIVLGNGFWTKVRRFERSFYDGTVIDCVRFISGDKFVEAGGFDELLTGPEDWDFDKRIRQIGKVDLISEPLFHNENEFNLRKYLEKKSYYAQSFKKYIQKWGRNDPDIRKQLGVGYRFFIVFLEKGKWRKLISHPILALGMFALRFLVGINFLMKKQ